MLPEASFISQTSPEHSEDSHWTAAERGQLDFGRGGGIEIRGVIGPAVLGRGGGVTPV